MRRSVIQHGPTTLTVSLPVLWVRRNNVKKGDELEMEEEGKFLKIYKQKDQLVEKHLEVDIKDFNEEIIRSLIGIVFKTGYDQLMLNYQDPEIFSFIQKKINSSLTGCEIIKQTSNSCIIKHIKIDSSKEFKNLIKRMFLILDSLGERSLMMVQKQDYDKSLLDLEDTMNRICNSCHRLINKGVVVEEKFTYLYLILWTIEGIADEYKYIIEFLLDTKHFPLNRKLVTLFKMINNLAKKYFELFYHYDHNKVQEFKNEIFDLKKEMDLIEFSYKNKIWLHMYNIINKYYESLNSIIGYHLD